MSAAAENVARSLIVHLRWYGVLGHGGRKKRGLGLSVCEHKVLLYMIERSVVRILYY